MADAAQGFPASLDDAAVFLRLAGQRTVNPGDKVGHRNGHLT